MLVAIAAYLVPLAFQINVVAEIILPTLFLRFTINRTDIYCA